ncbi:MAG: polysaccharide biosynthesis/export family protein, partial [Candidatus Methanomethylicaceae archaeon]
MVSFSLAQTYTYSSIKTTDVYYGFKVDPDKYILGVGDRLVIYIIKEVDVPEVYEVVISPTGMINLPVIGNIRISGLSLSEASKEIS